MKNTFRFYPGDNVPEWLARLEPTEKEFKKGSFKFTKKTKIIKRGDVFKAYFKGEDCILLNNALNLNVVCNFVVG